VPDMPPAASAPRAGWLGGAHGLVGLLAVQRVRDVRVQHAGVRRPRKDAALLREALGSDAPRAVRTRDGGGLGDRTLLGLIVGQEQSPDCTPPARNGDLEEGQRSSPREGRSPA